MDRGDCRIYTPGVQLEGMANRVAHNLCCDCPSSVMRLEGNDYLIEFNDMRISGGYNPGNHVWKSLCEGRQPQTVYTTEPYQQRYPLIATMLQEPAVNHSCRNIFDQCHRDFSSPARLDRLANDFATDRNPGAVDSAHGNLRLQPDAPVINAIGFRPIPVDEIGLYPDACPPPRNDLPPTKL